MKKEFKLSEERRKLFEEIIEHSEMEDKAILISIRNTVNKQDKEFIKKLKARFKKRYMNSTSFIHKEIDNLTGDLK